MKTLLRYLIAAPTFVWGAVFVYGAVLLRFAEDPKMVAPALFTARFRPWWAAKWKWSSTIGRGIIFHPKLFTPEGAFERINAHERVHVRQHEDLCLHGLVWALVAFLWAQTALGLVLWFLAPLATGLNYAMSWVRGADPYRDAEHERSAYAQTGDGHSH
jgi:hypothetical protein